MSYCSSCGIATGIRTIFCANCGKAVHPGPATLSGNKRLYVRSDETLLAEYNKVRVRQVLSCRATRQGKRATYLAWTAPTMLLTDKRIIFLNHQDKLDRYILGAGSNLSSMFSFWIYDLSLSGTLEEEYRLWQRRFKDICQQEWQKSKVGFYIKMMTGELKVEPSSTMPMAKYTPPASWMEIRSANIEKRFWGSHYLRLNIELEFAENNKRLDSGTVAKLASQSIKSMLPFTVHLSPRYNNQCGHLFIDQKWMNQIYHIIAGKLSSRAGVQ